MKRIPLFWHKSDNYGDCLAPLIVEKISGIKTVFVNDNSEKYCILGSILNDECITTSEIWGAGFVSPMKNPPRPLNIHAIRGPLTRQIYQSAGVLCPDVFGDPALLLPRLFPEMTASKKHEIGIVAHWVDRECVKALFGHLPIKIIDSMNPVVQVMEEILSCEKIISTSLHGLITALAFDIPAAWVTISGRVIGDGFKFADFLYSVGCKRIENKYTAGTVPHEFINNVHYHKINKFNFDRLYSSCPFLP